RKAGRAGKRVCCVYSIYGVKKTTLAVKGGFGREKRKRIADRHSGLDPESSIMSYGWALNFNLFTAPQLLSFSAS
ncbi:MAG: hypothetical protein PHC52_14230, partial [Syntrophales bacterium]|nr:hypothetical protein [Syntrophales bacterium]